MSRVGSRKFIALALFIASALQEACCDGNQSIYDPIKFTCEPLTPKVCRSKFRAIFLLEVLALHVNAVIEILQLYIPMTRELLKSEKIDNEYEDLLIYTQARLNVHLAYLEEHLYDEKKVRDRFSTLRADINALFESPHKPAEYSEALVKAKVGEKTEELKTQLLEDTTQLYKHIYAGLRYEDRKKYPEYKRIMAAVQIIGDKTQTFNHRMDQYRYMMTLLVYKFDVPVLQTTTYFL